MLGTGRTEPYTGSGMAYPTATPLFLTISVGLLISPTMNPQATAPAKPQEKVAAHPVTKEPAENERGHVHYLDYRNGFRGVKFGTPLSSFQGLELIQDTGATKIYRKTNDNLKIGEAQLEQIRYHFVDDKFMGVSLFSKDESDGQALLVVLELAYGKGIPQKPQPGGEGTSHPTHAHEFLWKGKVANARFTFADNHEAESWIGNNGLQDRCGQLQKKIAEAAAASLL
jgi:hypothetical protein